MSLFKSSKFWLSMAAVALFCAISYAYVDRALAGWLHATLPRTWVRRAGDVSVYGRAQWFLAPAVLFAAWAQWVRRDRSKVWGAAWFGLAIALGGVLNTVFKFGFGRCRPEKLLHEDLYGFTFWGVKSMYQSLPSGHANTAAAAAAVLWMLHPPLRPLYVFIPAVMMTARVLAEAHFLSDVVAGAALGVVSAVLARDLLQALWPSPEALAARLEPRRS